MARHLEPVERRVHHSLLIDYQISLAMELRWRALPAGSAIKSSDLRRRKWKTKHDHFMRRRRKPTHDGRLNIGIRMELHLV